ncbi:protein singed wings 2 isoform X2 [Leptidea sinapis]|uniref:protein singed wings 2 isoform X2 n=1 Tax=Leptidea sinapis TaxID=189913 RepID=UPI0021C25FA6|nr:protein singed wings 2 isoform X2 [Leptidea sinapis]
MKIGLSIILLLNCIEVAFLGTQLRKANSTEHSELRNCSLAGHTRQANCTRSRKLLHCTRGLTSEWLNGIKNDVKHLKLMDWTGPCINVDDIQYHFPNLHALDIVNSSRLVTFKGQFSPSSKIEILSIHGLTSLWEVPSQVVSGMSDLRVLDLRSNVLRHIKASTVRGPKKLKHVYLSDNKWDCSDGGLDWLAMENENSTTRKVIVDYYQLVCHQQLYKGKPLHKVMDIIKMVRVTCPDPCACAMTHVVSNRAGVIIPMITADCAKKNLETAPESLPPSTTTLRLEGNKLSSIRLIVQNPQYSKLMDLYLDNNKIHAVKELEGSEWFTTFRVLSLRGNLLKQIPVYAFDKAFQVNNNIMNVFLGHNPWRCDCHFIPRFQGLLLKYKRIIRDLPDIRCSKSDDKTISQISTMPLGNVCSSNEVKMPISTLNIVNLVLTFIIILILSKFLYDWHRFRTTGKLPWISSILP